MKFGRTYTLTTQGSDFKGGIVNFTISYPITLDFRIVRNTLAQANTGVFYIKNLKEETRFKLYHDRYDTLNYRRITLQAGYETEPKLPTIFRGNIISCYSYRQGADWITEINAFSGIYGMQNGSISDVIPAGADLRNAILKISSGMKECSVGAVGDFTYPTNSPRGTAVVGNRWEALKTMFPNADTFIDNEKVFILNKNEYVDFPDTVFEITSDTGLLQTPRRYDTRLDVTILFEPRLNVGQRVKLTSAETVYNGYYRVVGVNHTATISGVMGGHAITIASLWKGAGLMKAVPLQ